MSTLPSSSESDSTEAPSKTSKSSLDEKGSSQSTGKNESTETLTLIPENQSTQAPLDEPDLLPPEFSDEQIELLRQGMKMVMTF